MGKMERTMLDHMEDPKELEALYQKHPDQFTAAFDQVFARNPDSLVLQTWKARLSYAPVNETVAKYEKKKAWDVLIIVALSLLAGSLAKLVFELVEKEILNPVNMAFAILPVLALFFIIKNKSSRKLNLSVFLLFAGTLIYLNLLPLQYSDSIILASLHLPFFLWTLLGISFIGDEIRILQKRMDYLRYNGEVLIFSVLLMMGGMALTFITLALFDVLEINIIDFYQRNIVVYGIAAVPIVATYLTRTKSQANNIAPIIAKIFSPLMLITLVIYLITIVVLQKNPFVDRTFLFALNVMLLAVLALAIYAISERGSHSAKSLNDYIIALLVLVALIIDAIALGSIIARLTSFGITPNRTALLGINLLIFVNLLLIGVSYFRFIRGNGAIRSVEEMITKYLPVYALWTIIVTFGFPVLFNFK